MVSIFAVYDREANSMRYVIANAEGFNWQVVDTVTNEELHELMDTDENFAKATLLGAWDWEALTSEPAPLDHQFSDEEFELFKYCEYEFYKKYCADFGIKLTVWVDQLPINLYEQLTTECIDWHKENGENFKTDGYNVYPSSAYHDFHKEKVDRELQDIKDFKRIHDKLCEPAAIEQLCDTYYTIAVAGHSIKLPFGAQVYDAINDLLKDVIEEW